MRRLYQKHNVSHFEKRNAFRYYQIDLDNQIRIEKVKQFLIQARNKYSANAGSKPTILDIGCGQGEIGHGLMSLGFNVFGIDASSACVEKSLQKGIHAVEGNVEHRLPYPAKKFDFVFAGEIIEHVFDTKKFLSEIYRVLKPQGTAIITTPNLAHLPDRLRLLVGLNPAQVTPIHEFLHLHIRPFTINTLYAAAEVSGFRVVDIFSTLVVFQRNGDKVVRCSRLLAEAFPSLGSTLIAILERGNRR